MSKYIIVRTFCDKKDVADKIVNTLLEKKLVAGSQINEVYSKYWWNNEIEECVEYKLEFRSKMNLFDQNYHIQINMRKLQLEKQKTKM